VLHALSYLAVAAIFVGLIVALAMDRGSDPLWEQRWRDLGGADRKRIEAAVRSGALLADPEEIEIAAGLARRKGRTSDFSTWSRSSSPPSESSWSSPA
jgi:hypothetical protein